MEECTWQTVVLIPKGVGNFQGIGIIAFLWKTVTGILNLFLTTAIQFHDTFQIFRAGRGTGTASLESKLLQHLMVMREEVLDEIF